MLRRGFSSVLNVRSMPFRSRSTTCSSSIATCLFHQLNQNNNNNNISSSHSFSSTSISRYSEDFNSLDTIKSPRTSNRHQQSLIESRERRLQYLKRVLPEGETDILSEALVQTNSIDQVITLINLHHSVMNNRHVSEAFEAIHDLLRINTANSEYERIKLLSSPQFRMLCNRALKRMRFFMPHEVLNMLKGLILLGVSPQTKAMQSVLQMARHHINEFSINEIIFLDFLLSRNLMKNYSKNPALETEAPYLKMSHLHPDENVSANHMREPIIPLLEALKLALPLVLQVKIDSKELDFDDLNSVVKCLHLGASKRMKEEVINKLLAAVAIKLNELTMHQALSVVVSISELRPPHNNLNIGLVEKVSEECFEIIATKGVSAVPSDYPKHLIMKAITSPKPKFEYYHRGFFDFISELAIKEHESIGMSRVCHVLWSLSRYDYVNYELMDFIAEKIVSMDRKLIGDFKISYPNILSTFAMPANYKPYKQNSELLYETILQTSSIEYLHRRAKNLLFRILKNFVILQYYPKELIKDWVNSSLDDALNLATNIGTRKEFMATIAIIYQGLNLEMTSQTEEENDDESMKECINKLEPLVKEYVSFTSNEMRNKLKTATLHDCLSQGLGGNQFVASYMFSEYGHLIDNVIIMRKGNYPVAIKNINAIHLKELDLPEDSKIIGVIPLQKWDYCVDPFVIKGEVDFKIRTLKKAGITPLMVNIERWSEMLDREKIPFLMREIQEVCKDEVQQTNTN